MPYFRHYLYLFLSLAVTQVQSKTDNLIGNYLDYNLIGNYSLHIYICIRQISSKLFCYPFKILEYHIAGPKESVHGNAASILDTMKPGEKIDEILYS